MSVCVTTHDRLDCARINFEIIKLNYPRPWPIVHACSAPEYSKHLEDDLVRCEPLPLKSGAFNLLKSAIEFAVDKYRPDYIVHLEADAWILNQSHIERHIDRLHDDPRALVAASSWSRDRAQNWRISRNPARRLKYALSVALRSLGVDYGIRNRASLATQFFVAKVDCRLTAVIDAMSREIASVAESVLLEETFYRAVQTQFGRQAIIGMPEREPVHPFMRNICEPLSLYSQHWPTTSIVELPYLRGRTEISLGKKEILQAAKLAHIGPHTRRLLESADLAYYNLGARRT